MSPHPPTCSTPASPSSSSIGRLSLCPARSGPPPLPSRVRRGPARYDGREPLSTGAPSMTFVRAASVLILGALLLGAPAVRAQDGGKPPNDPRAPLPVRINQAIDSGVEWLKKQTFAPGNWSPEVLGDVLYDPNSKGDVYIHPTGCTSLSLYALLKSGVPKD